MNDHPDATFDRLSIAIASSQKCAAFMVSGDENNDSGVDVSSIRVSEMYALVYVDIPVLTPDFVKRLALKCEEVDLEHRFHGPLETIYRRFQQLSLDHRHWLVY
jgi:hypothetical protein